MRDAFKNTISSRGALFFLGAFFVAIGIAKAVIAGILYLRERRGGNA